MHRRRVFAVTLSQFVRFEYSMRLFILGIYVTARKEENRYGEKQQIEKVCTQREALKFKSPSCLSVFWLRKQPSVE